MYVLIAKDTSHLSPEGDEIELSMHQGLALHHPTWKRASEKGGVIARYYEDSRYIRAYGLIAYEGGVAIIYDKFYGSYSTITLGEDDGAWFPKESWGFTRKQDFIACLSEALSIFNANAKIE